MEYREATCEFSKGERMIEAMNERDLAVSILADALRDAQQQARGLLLTARLSGDRERTIEVIGEAQWYLLDDNDEDAVYSFPWACSVADLDPVRMRQGAYRALFRSGALLPKRERHRLAELAGKRRLRKIQTRDRVPIPYEAPPVHEFARFGPGDGVKEGWNGYGSSSNE